MGVIFEEDEPFGTVVENPSNVKDECPNFKEFVQQNCIDLSPQKQSELINLLVEHRQIFKDKSEKCKIDKC